MILCKNKLILVVLLLITLSSLSLQFVNTTNAKSDELFPGIWPVPLMMVRLKKINIAIVSAITLLSAGFYCHRNSGIKLFAAILILIILHFSLSLLALHVVNSELISLVKYQRDS
jgi:hypothetical protein